MAGDERMVYSAIEASGNQGTFIMSIIRPWPLTHAHAGIWSRTITNQTNLPNAVVTKILNKLMSSKQIKQVKAVNHPTRKMYMVSHIEPSVDLTGGPWYTDFELDPEFIGFVRSACLNFVSKKVGDIAFWVFSRADYGYGIPQSFPDPEDDSLSAPLFPTTWVDRYPNLHDILRFVKSAKITDVNLLPDHIEEIMNILIYEGLVEKLPAAGGGSVGGAASRKADESDDEDSDESMSTSSRKRKHKTPKKRRGSDDESESEQEEERKKKKRKKGRRSDSDEEKSDGERERSKKRKGSRKRNDSESDSDDEHSSRHRGRDKKRKRDRSRTLSSGGSGEDSNSDDDRRSKSRKKSRRGSGSEDSDDDRHKSSSRASKKSKGKKGKDGDDDEKIDLDSAFGHLLNTGSVYRAIRPERVGLGWSQAPCARCPQLEFCEDGGPVNPTGCKYYGDWLAQALGD